MRVVHFSNGFLLSILVSIVLIVTGMIKIIYPIHALSDFFIALGVFEIGLALTLFFFANYWKMWAITALIFASWGGYALYGTIFSLPCACLGSALELPRGMTLGIDLMILIGIGLVLKGSRAPVYVIKWTIVLSILLFIIGFYFGSFLYSMF